MALDELEGEQCDFCECGRDAELDEPFVPLHLGDPPQPQPVTSRGVQDNDRGSWSHKGKAERDAMLQAIQKMDGLTYDIHSSVMEVKAVGGAVHFAKTTDEGHMYTESPPAQDRLEEADSTAVELRFQPVAREVKPDAMVCQECAEMFRNLRD